MHKIYKIKQSFIQELYNVFNEVHLEDGITLLEEDFADTSYLRRYPHKYPYDANSEGYFSKNNLFNEIKSSTSLLEEEKNDLILTIEEGKRVYNKYKIWQEVPFSYLDKYADGFYFITPKSYIFYTPALIKNLISNPENFKGVAFDKWISRLLMDDGDNIVLVKFNIFQLEIMIKFLSNLLNDDYILEFIEVENIEKSIRVMNKETLLKKIKLEFQNVSLGDAYTLPEEDYADTSYWYFDKRRTNLNLTEEEWANQEIHLIDTNGWLPEDRQEAIQAIKEKRKMSNRFSNPLDIPFIYLDRYSTGFSYLKPKAYLFYTPAIMIYVLCDSEGFNSASFKAWLFRLSWANSYELITKLLKHFSKIQVDILIYFLRYVASINSIDINKERIKECLDNIKLLESNNG